jgi:CRISPR-associated protein Cas1
MIAKELDLIPVRALNQVTYCERLYWLEYVEAVLPINEHIEDGLFQHRRVNDPNLDSRPRKENGVVNTRSVAVCSERLGLTGKLDVLEEKDGVACPVEYKRGAGPSGEQGPPYWDNDAIQVCAQGMLLEETLERPIDHGVLFYNGSKSRVVVPFDASLREKTLAAIATVRRLSVQETPPPPLPAELRHRCHGCSLVGICQPEETLYQLQPPAEPTHTFAQESIPGLTRVIPMTDDGAVLYLQEPGSHVGVRSEHLVVRHEGVEISRVPLTAVRQVVLFGNVQISTQAQHTLALHEIPVAFLTPYCRFVAALVPAPAKNMNLRRRQYEVFADPAQSLELAREVVRSKLVNQRTLLMRSLRNRDDDVARGSHEPAAAAIADLLPRVDAATSIESLLGLEGQGASLYFGEFGRFLAPTPGRTFDFRTRNRRPPRDPVNALLSFAYALLTKDAFAAALTVGLDPYAGFYHQGRHGKPSLALDLMEEFRSVIADSVVLTLVNNRTLVPGDFLTWGEACQLTEPGRKKFFAAYEQRKATLVTHPIYGYRMSYSRMLEVQARTLAAYLRGDVPRYVGFTIR